MDFLPATPVSNEELAAMSLAVYEDTGPGAEAAFPVTTGKQHVVQGWRLVKREELEARDMRVDVYQSFRHHAYVVAVRGTVLSNENFRADFDVALGSVNWHLVEMIEHLSRVVQLIV